MSRSVTGIILKITPAKDFDSLITILTSDEGKLTVYGKSVHSPRSRRRTALEILNIINCTLSPGKSAGLEFLGEVKVLSEFRNLKNERQQYVEAFLLAEILNGLTQEQENYASINELLIAAAQLDQQVASLILFNYLLLQILDQLGFMPELNSCCLSQQPLSSAVNITTLPGQLGYAISQDKTNPDQELLRLAKVQTFWLSGVSYLTALKVRLKAAELRRLTNIQLDWAEIVLERALKSRFLFNSLVNAVY